MPVWFRLIASALLTLCAASAAGQTPGRTLLTHANGLITLHAEETPVVEIFEDLVARGLIRVTGMDKLATVATIEVKSHPIDAAVSALLADYNFVITWPKAAAGASSPILHVRVHSLRDPAAAAKGPISIQELRALRTADLEADLPDPIDPDDDPDARAEAEEEAKARAEEEEAAIAELAERERAGAFEPAASVENLSEMLDEDNARVRARALTALSVRTTQDALVALMRGLEDELAIVRYHAVDLLSRRTDSASLQQLGTVLVETEDPAARYGALMALAARADRASLVFVERVADDADPIIRAAAAAFLREMARRGPLAAPERAPRKPPLHDAN